MTTNLIKGYRGVVVPLKSTPGSIPEAPLQQECKRCGKQYPIKGIMVCPCINLFDMPHEKPIEFKTEDDCKRFMLWLKTIEEEHKHEISLAEERSDKRWRERLFQELGHEWEDPDIAGQIPGIDFRIDQVTTPVVRNQLRRELIERLSDLLK